MLLLDGGHAHDSTQSPLFSAKEPAELGRRGGGGHAEQAALVGQERPPWGGVEPPHRACQLVEVCGTDVAQGERSGEAGRMRGHVGPSQQGIDVAAAAVWPGGEVVQLARGLQSLRARHAHGLAPRDEMLSGLQRLDRMLFEFARLFDE